MPSSWIYALIGGAIIGLSSTILLIFNGRISGISGIFFGAMNPIKGDTMWRWKFLVGLLIGGSIASTFVSDGFVDTSGVATPLVIAAGLLVGFGTRLGGGCTSGHGVCGISRFSIRSILATVSFIVAGAITVAIMNSL